MKQFKYIFNNISIRDNSEVWIQFDSVDKLIDSLNEFDIKYIIIKNKIEFIFNI